MCCISTPEVYIRNLPKLAHHEILCHFIGCHFFNSGLFALCVCFRFFLNNNSLRKKSRGKTFTASTIQPVKRPSFATMATPWFRYVFQTVFRTLRLRQMNATILDLRVAGTIDAVLVCHQLSPAIWYRHVVDNIID